jgi:hypothetical protein
MRPRPVWSSSNVATILHVLLFLNRCYGFTAAVPAWGGALESAQISGSASVSQ